MPPPRAESAPARSAAGWTDRPDPPSPRRHTRPTSDAPLPGDTEPFGNVRDRRPGQHVLDGSIPLFHHAHLHQHTAECHPGPDTDLSRRSRDRTGRLPAICENFLYTFKAARQAGRTRRRQGARPTLRRRCAPARANARRLARTTDTERPPTAQSTTTRRRHEAGSQPAARVHSRRAWWAHASAAGHCAKVPGCGPGASGGAFGSGMAKIRTAETVSGWLRGAIPPAIGPGKPSRPAAGRQGRTSGRALHLADRRPVCFHSGRADGTRDGKENAGDAILVP